MPSWTELVGELGRLTPEAVGPFLNERLTAAIKEVQQLRGDRNVIFYASAFLQKQGVPGDRVMITHEDINGLMAVIHGMDCSKGLTLMLHTPGGVTNAAESIVAYLRAKFGSNVEVLVPAFAMSAGTMIALASDNIIMGRQSQLGPIDPQFTVGQRSMSARSVVEQFDRAKTEVLDDQRSAHLWAPIVQSLGPSLLQEAQNALDYSERMVAKWLETGMCRSDPQPEAKGAAIAYHFNDASTHKSHGRRIDRDEARSVGVKVEDLEDSQPLQEAALTAYHLATIMFDNSLATKFMIASHGPLWIKNFAQALPMQVVQSLIEPAPTL